MRGRRGGWAWLLLALPLLGARAYIEVEAPGQPALPLCLEGFGGRLGAEVREVVASDLDLTGLFELVGPAEAQVRLRATVRAGGGPLEVTARLEDLVRGRTLWERRLRGEDLRELGHRLSGEVYRSLTGKRGFFLSKIAFVSRVDGHREVFLADFDGHRRRRLTFHRSYVLCPALSPDGRWLAFISFRHGRPELYLRDLQSGKEWRPLRLRGTPTSPAWSPRGTLALSLSLQGVPDLFLLEPRGGKLRRLTRDWATDVSPSFSPDGRLIAFCSNRAGTPQIYVMELDSGKTRRITFEGRYNAQPAWSPRGDAIAFASLRGDRFDLFLTDPRGTWLQRLTAGPGSNEHPSFSPDGRLIAFCSNRAGGYALYLIRADGSGLRRISPPGAEDLSPCWISGTHR